MAVYTGRAAAERAKWLSESIGRTLYPEFPDWFCRLN